jgi:hypothetical protein
MYKEREKRGGRRQPLRYSAWLALAADQRHDCMISNVSQSGARIDVRDSSAIPDHFVLMLTSTGSARRFCRVMWREPNQIGVQFARSLAEAAEPAKPGASTDGVPPPDEGEDANLEAAKTA